MKILACNVGSTSLKFKLFDMPDQKPLAECKIERVGSLDDAIYNYACPEKNIYHKEDKQSIPEYNSGIHVFLNSLTSGKEGIISETKEIEVVSFKTVLARGFYGVHYLNNEVMKGMRDYMSIAGSHNGPYVKTIGQFRELLPGAKAVGVFETAFHRTVPLERALYGIPYEWYQKYGIRKMGYHGASHGYISDRVNELFCKKSRLISCHLGGSNSICAILNGESVDTSFGISLQTGVLHGARTGDCDTFLVPFLLGENLSLDEITEGLVQKGGLLGISGVSADLRYVERAAAEGNMRAQLAINVYCSHIIRYIGAFYAELGGLDFLAFTGGIGENSDLIRKKVCNAIKHLGIILDEEKNSSVSGETVITTGDSPATAMVIPTDEERYIAKRAYNFIMEGTNEQ
jgi:acetate kinase